MGTDDNSKDSERSTFHLDEVVELMDDWYSVNGDFYLHEDIDDDEHDGVLPKGSQGIIYDVIDCNHDIICRQCVSDRHWVCVAFICDTNGTLINDDTWCPHHFKRLIDI